jgi:hypothetical protein
MSFSQVLQCIVAKPDIHARWLNTLSLMENTGSRKIAASQDRVYVSVALLKHAAEEARHALFFKSQINKVANAQDWATYESSKLLAPHQSRRYLDLLSVRISRILKNELGLHKQRLQYGAYLLVTYAIELRAQEIYGSYQTLLQKAALSIPLKTVLVEETEHLKEMESMMVEFFGESWSSLAARSQVLEVELFARWSKALETEVQLS